MAYSYLAHYVDRIQSEGRYYFTREEVLKLHTGSEASIKLALNRLSRKKHILSVRHGFYVIIPVEYTATGILPPLLFIEDLMKYLDKDYYLALLSAAAIHGAAHQQPQEYHIITTAPERTIYSAGIKIKFFVKSGNWKQYKLLDHKTDVGYLKVSSPELTAIDLIAYEKHIGGLNRVATVLEELSEKIDKTKLLNQAKDSSALSYIQRLGYLLDKILHKKSLATPLKGWLEKQKPFQTPLKRGVPTKGFPIDTDWNIIINTEVESEL